MLGPAVKIPEIALEKSSKLSAIKRLLFLFASAFSRLVSSTDSLAETRPLPLTLRLLIVNTVLMVLCVTAGIFSEYNEPGRYFREGRLMTWISTFQLAAFGYICSRIFQLTRQTGVPVMRDPGSIWRLASVSFYFLAFDEIMKVHETIDRYSHKLLGVLPTDQTDHLDDIILLIYALAGLSIVMLHYRQIPRFIGSIGFIIFAVCTSAISIYLDFLSGDRAEIFRVFQDKESVAWYMTWLGVFEEFFKIYAEVFFIGAALYCYHVAYSQREHQKRNVLEGVGALESTDHDHQPRQKAVNA